MKEIVFGIVGVSLAFGCSSENVYMQPVRQYRPSAANQDGYAKSSPDSGSRVNHGVGRVGNVRTGEIVKAYGANRYVDPADPYVMHERHAIYRVEEGSGWVMQTPPGGRGIILGPVVGLKNPEDAPAPREDEIRRELLSSREASQKNNEELDQIRQNQEGMGQYMKESAEAQAKLALIAESLNKRLKKVEQRTGTDKEPDSTERDERTIPK